MINKLFGIRDFDGHYILTILGIKIAIKHRCNFKYKPATEIGLNEPKRNPQIIVSLTSYPDRISTTHLTVNTLLQQTLKPDRIILWLAESQFPNKRQDLPSDLLKLQKYGLEVKWCEDYKSYKKLIPAIKEYPNDIVVTADDDIYYETDWLETLYDKYKQHNCVICQRPRCLCVNNTTICALTSRKAENIDLSMPTYKNQQLGGTGCLYPPHSLHLDILDYQNAKNLLPTNDDIYFWAMAVLNKTKIGVAKGFAGNIYQMDFGKNTLGNINMHLETEENKDPFAIITQKYPQILQIIKEDK